MFMKQEKNTKLTVNAKHAAVLAADKPFLVSSKGPNLMTMYE